MKNARFRRRSRWREVVYAKAMALEYELDRLIGEARVSSHAHGISEPLIESARTSVCRHLTAARELAAPRRRGVGPLWRLVAGGEGAATDGAFVNLHAAKVALVDLYTWQDIEAAAPAVLARLRSSKSADDDRLKSAEAALDGDLKTAEPAQQRRPPQLQRVHRALSVAFTVQRLRGTSAPYDIPLALTINKLPSGVLTSIVGLILIQGDFIPGLSELDNQGQILAYAVLFGFAQHLATRYIDQKAEEVIESVPKKSSQPAKQRDNGRRPHQERARRN